MLTVEGRRSRSCLEKSPSFLFWIPLSTMMWVSISTVFAYGEVATREMDWTRKRKTEQAFKSNQQDRPRTGELGRKCASAHILNSSILILWYYKLATLSTDRVARRRLSRKSTRRQFTNNRLQLTFDFNWNLKTKPNNLSTSEKDWSVSSIRLQSNNHLQQ